MTTMHRQDDRLWRFYPEWAIDPAQKEWCDRHGQWLDARDSDFEPMLP